MLVDCCRGHLLDTPLVFFRSADGAVASLADRCPHRFAPLSKGRLCDGGATLQCPYHGLRFDSTGACVHNPHSNSSIPKAARVDSYAAVERHGLLWWWAGISTLADESLIPDYREFANAPPDATIRGYLPTDCHYELLVDNILDLTHADYLHAGTLGNGSLTSSQARITDLSERSLDVTWLSSGERAVPAFDPHLRRPGEPSDQWTAVTWTAPGNMLLRVGATLQGEANREAWKRRRFTSPRRRAPLVRTTGIGARETSPSVRKKTLRSAASSNSRFPAGQADARGPVSQHGRG
jgi:vanillate O-demethylase monooxygenase subunit